MNTEDKKAKLTTLMEDEEAYNMVMQAVTVLGAVCQEIQSDSFSVTLIQDKLEWAAEFKILSSEKVEETCNTEN